jgi:ceramide glucosyltransferase
MSALQVVLAVVLAFSWLVLVAEALASYYLLRRRLRVDPPRWPSFSVLKPMAGLDDDLEENLASHLALEYPGEFELILGIRSERDAAYPVAKAFAEQHPDRVRLVLQEGEPGLNPKVNQLITLTRHARHEVIALTDANVRVPRHWLVEHARYLAREGVGLTSNAFFGTGEASLGSALDNLTLASFALPNLATGDVLLRLSQIVSKSIAIKREALEAVGGWAAFKDLLAEDQRLGSALRKAGYKTAICRTPVENVQRTQGFSHFWGRSCRWAMMRFRVVVPGVYLEPLLNPTVLSTLLLLAAPGERWAWLAWGASMLWSAAFTQAVAVMGRPPFALRWLLLVPLRDYLLFAAWVRGRFMRTVDWRGNVLLVGKDTALSRP